MIRTVDCPVRVMFGSDPLDVHAYAECWRAPDKRIECHITCVMLDGRDVTLNMLANESAVAQIKMRLACEYFAKPIRETPDESAAWNDDGPPGGSAA